MDKILKILSKIGLNEKQAVVYTTLLPIGGVSMTDLAKATGLKRPTVYLIIEELDILGLISITTKGKKKIYTAVHPKRLAEMLEFRKNQYQELLPELVAWYNSDTTKPQIRMQEGIEGLRSAYKEAFTDLAKEKEGLWIGNIELLETYFPQVLKEYATMLQTLKHYTIREIIFGGEKGKKFVTQFNKNKNHQLRYWDTEKSGATDELIIGNKVMTFCFSEKEIFTLITESREIANTRRALFEKVWSTLN